MFITKKQLEEIRKGLAMLGVRDTDLPDASVLTGTELVAIVQDGENRIVPIGDLFGKYLEGMLPYAVRGLSAYEVAVANGFEGTIAEWLASLRAGVEIDNNFAGGIYKVASAEEAKVLKEMIESLSGGGISWSDVVNTYTGGSTRKVMSAAAGLALYNALINKIPSGGSNVQIVDNLTDGGSNKALSAEQGKILKQLFDTFLELNNGIQKIYNWTEFQTISSTVPDIYYDSKSSIVDARVVYELWRLIKDLDARVKDLESGSGSGSDSGDDEGTVTYKLVVSSDNDIHSISATGTTNLKATYIKCIDGVETAIQRDVTTSVGWSSNNPYVTVSGGTVKANNPSDTIAFIVDISANYEGLIGTYQIAVAKAGGGEGGGEDEGDVTPVLEPYISISPNTARFTNEGKYIISADSVADSATISVATNNTTSSWVLSDNQNFTWFDARKDGGNLIIENVHENLVRTDERSTTIKVCLATDSSIESSLTVVQEAYDYSTLDFTITDWNGRISHTFPAMGDELLLVIHAPGPWTFTCPEWVTPRTYIQNEIGGVIDTSQYVGSAGETVINIKVGASATSRAVESIVGTLVDSGETATFYVSLDSTLADFISLRDIDGMSLSAISADWTSPFRMRLVSSGPWTIIFRGHYAAGEPETPEWVKFLESDNYTKVDDYTLTGDATTSDGINIWLQAQSCIDIYGRSVYVRAYLDDTELHSWCHLSQYGTMTGNFMPVLSTEKFGAEGGTTDLKLLVRNSNESEWTVTGLWYIFKDYSTYPLPEGITIPAEYEHLQATGHTVYYPSKPTNAISGITVLPLDQEQEETTREIVLQMHYMGGGLLSGSIPVTIYQGVDVDEQEEAAGGGDSEITTNTLAVAGKSTVDPRGEAVTYTITTEAGWTASVTNGATISANSGTGNGTVTVTFPANNINKSKSFVLTVTSADDACVPKSKTITVSQGVGVILTASPNNVSIPSSETSATFTLTSSAPWEIKTSLASKFRVSPSSGNATYTRWNTTTGTENTPVGTTITVTYTGSEINQVSEGIGIHLTGVTGYSIVSVQVTKEAAVQESSIQANPKTVQLALTGSTETSEMTVVPNGAAWLYSITSGDQRILSLSQSGNVLSIGKSSANTSSSDLNWTVKVYVPNTEASDTIQVSQPKAYISVSSSSITVPATASTPGELSKTVSVSSNVEWVANVTTGDFITLGSYTSTSLPFTVASNMSGTQRVAVITLTPANTAFSGLSATITVTQAAQSTSEPYYTVSVSPAGGMMSAASGSANVTIVGKYHNGDTITDANWNVLAQDEGISSSVSTGTGTGTALISWIANASTTDSVTKRVRITCGTQSDMVDTYFSITQSPADPATEWTIADDQTTGINILSFDSNSTTHNLYVTCSRPWSSSFTAGSGQATWLHGATATGNANQQVTLNLSATQSTSRQTGTITFTTTDSGTVNTHTVSCSCEAAENNVE